MRGPKTLVFRLRRAGELLAQGRRSARVPFAHSQRRSGLNHPSRSSERGVTGCLSTESNGRSNQSITYLPASALATSLYQHLCSAGSVPVAVQFTAGRSGSRNQQWHPAGQAGIDGKGRPLADERAGRSTSVMLVPARTSGGRVALERGCRRGSGRVRAAEALSAPSFASPLATTTGIEMSHGRRHANWLAWRSVIRWAAIKVNLKPAT